MHCAICKNHQLKKFLSLGHQPPSDAFVREEGLSDPEITYPLDLYFCKNCTLVQLGYAVDPEILFRDYVYNSGSNNALKANFAELVSNVIETYVLQKGDLAIDIGSNDGALLENYLQYGVNILGIDPSSVTSIAIEKGIPTVVDFFNKTTAERAAKQYGRAKIITATNVFAHVDDLDSFMEGVTTLLSPEGVFITESGYVVDMIEGMQYDSIYHEHLRYYSMASLNKLFERFNMEIIRTEKIKSHGGSIRVYASMRGAHKIDPSVEILISKEKESGYHDIAPYEEFAMRVAETKLRLLEIILGLKKEIGRAHV